MQTIAQVTCAVYWFNPLVWFAVRWMRIEAEQACDDQVINAGYHSTEYAQLLLDITHNVKIAKATSRAAVAIARSSKIERRLRTVLAENLNRHPVTKIAAGIGLLVFICFAIPIGTMRLAQAINPEETFKSHPTPEELSSKPNAHGQDVDLKQDQKYIEICTQNMLAIGKAIQTYKKEHDDFPEWLSELHPKYLSDASVLLCPADKLGGKPIFTINADPNMPVSYGYQFHPRYREGTQENRAIYGDVIPLVRCRHHVNQPFDCLNLGFSFRVYTSSGVWENTPWEMYENAEEAITVLEAGLHQKQTNVGYFRFYLSFVRHYVKIGQEKDAELLLNYFKSTIPPNSLQAHFTLADMLETMQRNQEALEVFKKLETQYSDDRDVLQKLSQIYEKLGNDELATEYRKKFDPTSELVGKVMPDFAATDLNGKPISLQQYRGKVVLLDFWAVWSRPCIAEMPIVKKVYNTYKNQGFDIIGVSLDTEEKPLRDYLQENDIQWRQIFSGKRWDCPLAQKYDVHAIPAPWLIAKDGTLISREARVWTLERMVIEALKDKSKDQ